MPDSKYILVVIVGLVMYSAGWFTARQKTNQHDQCSKLHKMQMFSSAYNQTVFAEALSIKLDAGEIESAKDMLRTHQDGHIFMLDHLVSSPQLTESEFADLREFNASVSAPYGSMREQSDRILARVAERRLSSPESASDEVEAKLAAILRAAADRVK